MLKLRFSQPFKKQYLDGKISLCKYNCIIIDNSDKSVISKFSVTGTAKCAPNDSVDPEFGMKLADSRAKLSAYREAAKLLPKYVEDEWLDDIGTKIAILEFIDQMRFLKKKEFMHIEDICDAV